MAGREHAGFRLRLGRQDEGGEAPGFLPADGEKASGLLGTLAEELNGYSRRKGGFSFRFGRRRRGQGVLERAPPGTLPTTVSTPEASETAVPRRRWVL